jgi:hypothetical protein
MSAILGSGEHRSKCPALQIKAIEEGLLPHGS